MIIRKPILFAVKGNESGGLLKAIELVNQAGLIIAQEKVRVNALDTEDSVRSCQDSISTLSASISSTQRQTGELRKAVNRRSVTVRRARARSEVQPRIAAARPLAAPLGAVIQGPTPFVHDGRWYVLDATSNTVRPLNSFKEGGSAEVSSPVKTGEDAISVKTETSSKSEPS